MDSSIRRTLWAAFIVLSALVLFGLGLTLAVLQLEKRQEYQAVHASQPLVDAVKDMDRATDAMLSASRAFTLTRETQFANQYDESVRDFDRAMASAMDAQHDARDLKAIGDFHRDYDALKAIVDQQMQYAGDFKQEEAVAQMLAAAKKYRSWPDYAGRLEELHRRGQARDLDRTANMRQAFTLLLAIVSLVIIVVLGFTIWNVDTKLRRSFERQTRRNETVIAGMSDGVMLIDGEGRVIYVNPAGQQMLGDSGLGVPIFKHPEVFHLRNEGGGQIDPKELPSVQALATGRTVRNRTLKVARPDREITIAASATPLKDEGRITGVILTFSDITERRHLEEELQMQAERAQTIADAGVFFTSNIDPAWVNQAIAERTAEVLGDWSAVILKTGTSDLRVASIYHRDMTSIGLAWSYIYRQPLVVGEGIIGQVVTTGYPSMMVNVASGVSAQMNETSYHAPTMQLASLLILPLRTRREMLGALVIAAHDPERRMTDEKLPLAEVLAERAALAIENAKLYTEQVEARRKVEDLSRLKDEFLSIASHELRTPVTSIKGYTQLAKTLIRENDLVTSEEYLDIALDQIDRMSRLILELLDVSRIETGRLEIRREPIQWTSFVSEVVHRHHTAVSNRRFNLNLPVAGKYINGDRDRLEQVLGNLLENAVKYSPDGSEISVGVEEKENEVITSVRDRGIGIPVDEITQVFERFHRGRQVSSTNYGGLGLGLYITKQIVERHGGQIWVESAEGVGTAFFFTLPVVQAPQPKAVPRVTAGSTA